MDERFVKTLERIRWAGKPVCPYCKSARSTILEAELRHRWLKCRSAYSVTVGTLFHRSRLPLSKWFEALTIMETSATDPSVRELARGIDVNKNTACYMSMRIRRARVRESSLLWGICEEMKTCVKGGGKIYQCGGAKVSHLAAGF